MARSKSKQKRRKIQIRRKRRERERKLRKRLLGAKVTEEAQKPMPESEAVPKGAKKTAKKALSQEKEDASSSSTEVNSPVSS